MPPLLRKVLLSPVTLLRMIGRVFIQGIVRLFAPAINLIDSSPRLSDMINSLSSAMATQRGLPLLIGTGIVVLSLLTLGIVMIGLVMTNSFDRNLYWLCIPFTLLHIGVLAGFTGAMLAIPLGQGYKDK
jgi:hypothetical protein